MNTVVLIAIKMLWYPVHGVVLCLNLKRMGMIFAPQTVLKLVSVNLKYLHNINFEKLSKRVNISCSIWYI